MKTDRVIFLILFPKIVLISTICRLYPKRVIKFSSLHVSFFRLKYDDKWANKVEVHDILQWYITESTFYALSFPRYKDDLVRVGELNKPSSWF